MSSRRNANVETAVQYLTWALEEIEKSGNREAARHARIAMKALSEGARAIKLQDERGRDPVD